MKNILFLLAFITQVSFAQETELSVKVNPNSVLIGNTVHVQYEIHNSKGEFIPPEMPGFEIIGGPNYSCNFSMMNGTSSSIVTYSYILLPLEEGNLTIGAASVGDLIAEPVQVEVLPNPDGIIIKKEDEYSMPDIWQRQQKPAKKKIERKKGIRI